MSKAPCINARQSWMQEAHTNHQREAGRFIILASRSKIKGDYSVRHIRRRKRKTVWAYLDGKKLVDVVQAALDNRMMVDDL